MSPARSIAIAFAQVSPLLPLKYVEKTQMPGSVIVVTKLLMEEAGDGLVFWKAPELVSRLKEVVAPAMLAFPLASAVIARPESAPPPQRIEYTAPSPPGFNFVTKAVDDPPAGKPCDGPTTGKSADAVTPVTYVKPALSTAIPLAASKPEPPT